MLIVMSTYATQAEIENVCRVVRSLGFDAHALPGAQTTAVCVTNNPGAISAERFVGLPGVSEVIRVSKPYKLASLETRREKTIIPINGCNIGADFLMIAGPCSVETQESTFRIADQLANLGVKFFRAGAYKPRTGPYSFQGHGVEGLELLQKVKEKFGMAIVTEAMDVDSAKAVAQVADIIQVGTRNMQNTSLLKMLGTLRTPVLLKRGMSATLEEFLLAAEYIMAGGNYQIILCERGIRTFSHHARNTLDVAAIPALQKLTHLPIIVDPSHAAGVTYMVASLARAGVAAGADGLIIEVHDDAVNALSDGQQALHPDDLKILLKQITVIRSVL